jgi:hypothetical protein
MKKVSTFILVVAMLLLYATTATATPASYNSGFQVQNLSTSSAATITMSFYALNNGSATTVNDTIAAGSSNTYFPLDGSGTVELPAGFSGSAVISSDQPVAAIANLIGDAFTAGASYGSFSGGSETVSLPLIAKGQVSTYDTFFNVQNVGSGTADITVAYAGTACTETANAVPAGAAVRFDQATNSCLANGHVGAASVTAGTGQEIVATVVETTRNNTGLYAYNGFVSSAPELVIPLVQFNNVGFHSGVQIQNVGAASTDVTVTYMPAGGIGTECTETGTIAAGASGTFGLFAFSLTGGSNTDTCTDGERFVGSASVTTNSGNEPLVAIINQTNFTNFASSYNGFNPANATASLSMPLLMDRNFGYYTGFNLQNVGSGSANVTCTYSTASNGGDIADTNYTLAAGEAANALQLNQASQATYVGSASCTSDGEPIIAVVNELGSGTTVDLLFTYEAFNQ